MPWELASWCIKVLISANRVHVNCKLQDTFKKVKNTCGEGNGVYLRFLKREITVFFFFFFNWNSLGILISFPFYSFWISHGIWNMVVLNLDMPRNIWSKKINYYALTSCYVPANFQYYPMNLHHKSSGLGIIILIL